MHACQIRFVSSVTVTIAGKGLRHLQKQTLHGCTDRLLWRDKTPLHVPRSSRARKHTTIIACVVARVVITITMNMGSSA